MRMNEIRSILNLDHLSMLYFYNIKLQRTMVSDNYKNIQSNYKKIELREWYKSSFV